MHTKKLLFIWSLLLVLPLSIAAQTKSDSLLIVKTKWHKEKQTKGLRSLHASFTSLYGAPQDIYIVDVKLKKHTADVCVHDGRELTTEHAKKENAVAAVNGTFFDMREGGSVCYIARKGDVAGWTGDPRSDGAIEMDGKKVSIIGWSPEKEKAYDPSGKSIMVSGPLLILNGKSVATAQQSGNDPRRHPRTAVMLTKKNHLFLIVVDGRHKGVAEGMTIPELEHFCKCMKATDALNLDGGGSSIIWTKKSGILNNPSDKRERTVANSVLVF